MAEAPTSIAVYTKLQRIAKQASDAPQIVFNNLIHLVDLKLNAHELSDVPKLRRQV